MKALFALLSFTLATIPAHAETDPPPHRGLECHSTGVFDAGFDLSVAGNQRSAELSAISLAGPHPVARLGCVLVLQGHFIPDVPRNFLLCSGFSPRFGRLAVRLYTPGNTRDQLDTASVRRVTIFRGRRVEQELQFGHLVCGSAH
jgi:hypothetical protein